MSAEIGQIEFAELKRVNAVLAYEFHPIRST